MNRILVELTSIKSQINILIRLVEMQEREKNPIPKKPIPKSKQRWNTSKEILELAQELDPDEKWNVPNNEFPREMSDLDVTAMIATKLANCTKDPTLWMDREKVEIWLRKNGITIKD